MVEVGRDRSIDLNCPDGIEWTVGDAEALPLPDGSVDAYTIAFGLRNVTQIDTALSEARRVLRPGGQLLVGEWCRSPEPYSANMDRFFELEGLTYHMATLESYGAGLCDCGFDAIELFDVSNQFAILSQDQYDRVTGSMKEQMLALVGDEETARITVNWRQLLIVIDNGDLRPGHMRARKPH